MGGSTWSRLAIGAPIVSNKGYFVSKHQREDRRPIHDWIANVDNTSKLVAFLQKPRGPNGYTILPTEKNGKPLLLQSKSGTKGDKINENLTFKVEGKKE